MLCKPGGDTFDVNQHACELPLLKRVRANSCGARDHIVDNINTPNFCVWNVVPATIDGLLLWWPRDCVSGDGSCRIEIQWCEMAKALIGCLAVRC